MFKIFHSSKICIQNTAFTIRRFFYTNPSIAAYCIITIICSSTSGIWYTRCLAYDLAGLRIEGPIK